MGLYTLTDDSEGHKAAQLALASPESYVMKPQREGGGNMLVGDETCNALKTMSAEVTWPRILTPPVPPLSHARALSLCVCVPLCLSLCRFPPPRLFLSLSATFCLSVSLSLCACFFVPPFLSCRLAGWRSNAGGAILLRLHAQCRHHTLPPTASGQVVDLCVDMYTCRVQERAAYILMERIVPPLIENYIMRASKATRYTTFRRSHFTFPYGELFHANIVKY